jgi:hypothetical protein
MAPLASGAAPSGGASVGTAGTVVVWEVDMGRVLGRGSNERTGRQAADRSAPATLLNAS